MKFFRYRRSSLKTILGITKAKKQIKKELGITDALKPLRWWSNQKRKFKRDIGYESNVGRILRNGLPKAGGCLVVLLAITGCGVVMILSVLSVLAQEKSAMPTTANLLAKASAPHRANHLPLSSGRNPTTSWPASSPRTATTAKLTCHSGGV